MKLESKIELFRKLYALEAEIQIFGERFVNWQTLAERERRLNTVYANRLIHEYNLFKYRESHAN